MPRAADIFGLLFAAWAGVSLVWSPAPLWGAFLLALLAGGYVLGQQLRCLRWLWVWLCAAATANLGLAWAQAAMWWEGGDFRWYGLAGSSGRLGVVMAMCFAAALVFRLWWFVPVGIAGLAWAGSRGSIVAAGVAGMLWLWRSHRASAMCLALSSILVALVFRDDAGASLVSRLGIWQDTLNHLTPWGHGFASFAAEYAAWPQRIAPALQFAQHPYNDLLELLFDLGVGAVPAVLCIIAAFERYDDTDRLVCVVFLLCGLTFFPSWTAGPIFALSLGHLSAYGAVRRKPTPLRPGQLVSI